MESMAKVWILDTATKGTGATMVPLDERKPAPVREPEPIFVPPERPGPQPEPVAPRPRRFRVVDVLSTLTLAEDADLRTVVELLAGVGKAVDVRMFAWDYDGGRWRLLSSGERRALWEAGRRRRAPQPDAAGAAQA
jgi:hypothetical protein